MMGEVRSHKSPSWIYGALREEEREHEKERQKGRERGRREGIVKIEGKEQKR